MARYIRRRDSPKLDRYGRPNRPHRARRLNRLGRLRSRTFAAGVLVVVLVGAGAVAVATAHNSGDSATAGDSASQNGSYASATGQAANGAINTSPLKTRAATRWVASRKGQVTAAVENLHTGRIYLLNRGNRDQTASIIKVDILETLMHQRGQTSSGLESIEDGTADAMIQASDDDAATDLWNEVGGGPGVAAYNHLVGLKHTTTNDDGYWGESLTSAADQLKLLHELARPSKLLTKADRAYELYLMRHIDAGQDWGVSGGIPKGVSIALKNGWVPLTGYSDWEINSIGWIHGHGRDYLIAVLTAHDPSESYGIATISKLSGDVYRSLKPAAHS